ncbi:MAG: 4Fe-4S dicluster domain-containing protein [Actinobacteria bacterium]|nr:4Fe-4S dicluster domain-containing protein [Actinomycetota bacterium]
MTVAAPPVRRGFSASNAPDPAVMQACVHCGMCLNECPTYRVIRLEMDSPRGRIQLIKGVNDGHIALDSQVFLAHTFRCLDCRGCETACPSGVKYGRLIEAVRDQTARAGLLPRRRRIASWVLRHVFTRRTRLRRVGQALRLYQRLGVQAFIRRLRILAWVWPALAQVEAMAPAMSRRFLDAGDLRFVPAVGPARYRVAFVTGCIMSLAFAEVHRASLRVLARRGCDIEIPEHQQCCGALHIHGGDRASAQDLARRNIDAFEGGGYDAILTNSAGCGSALKEYGQLLAGDPAYAERAHRFAAKVQDLSEFLAACESGHALGELRRTVVYQDACHLAHGQGITRQPRDLLRAIPGLTLVEMRNPAVCCGSAGLYSVTDTATSLQVLDEKLDALEGVEADTVVSANPGCLLHLRLGVKRRGLKLRVVHLAELLDEAYAAARADGG